MITGLLPYPGALAHRHRDHEHAEDERDQGDGGPAVQPLELLAALAVAWRYVGIWMTIQASQAASDSTMTAA